MGNAQMKPHDFPKAQAFKDFKQGLGQADNPYPRKSTEWEEYAWEMHRLWNEELKAEIR